jgi:hypothetical protein
MTAFDENTFWMLGSYFVLVIMFYFLVSLMLYLTKNSEIKILNIIKDPKKGSRGRKHIGDYIEKSNKEKRLTWLWPYLLFQELVSYVKARFEKKKK